MQGKKALAKEKKLRTLNFTLSQAPNFQLLSFEFKLVNLLNAQAQNAKRSLCSHTHLTVINRLEFSLVNLSYCDINQSRAFRWMKNNGKTGWQLRVCVRADEAAHTQT